MLANIKSGYKLLAKTCHSCGSSDHMKAKCPDRNVVGQVRISTDGVSLLEDNDRNDGVSLLEDNGRNDESLVPDISLQTNY